MTRTERYINEANNYGATVVIKEIDNEVNKLKTQLNHTKNSFRATCIMQQIESYNNDRNLIESMFID